MTTTEAQAALDQLGAALEALSPSVRMVLAQQTLAAGGTRSATPASAKPFWLALYAATEGATPERLEHVASTLEVAGGALRQSLVVVARRAQTGDALTDMWAALCTLADTVVA